MIWIFLFCLARYRCLLITHNTEYLHKSIWFFLNLKYINKVTLLLILNLFIFKSFSHGGILLTLIILFIFLNLKIVGILLNVGHVMMF